MHHRQYGNKVTAKHLRKFGEKLREGYPTLANKISHSYLGNSYSNTYPEIVKGEDKVSSDLERHKHRKHYA